MASCWSQNLRFNYFNTIHDCWFLLSAFFASQFPNSVVNALPQKKFAKFCTIFHENAFLPQTSAISLVIVHHNMFLFYRIYQKLCFVVEIIDWPVFFLKLFVFRFSICYFILLKKKFLINNLKHRMKTWTHPIVVHQTTMLPHHHHNQDKAQ